MWGTDDLDVQSVSAEPGRCGVGTAGAVESRRRRGRWSGARKYPEWTPVIAQLTARVAIHRCHGTAVARTSARVGWAAMFRAEVGNMLGLIMSTILLLS